MDNKRIPMEDELKLYHIKGALNGALPKMSIKETIEAPLLFEDKEECIDYNVLNTKKTDKLQEEIVKERIQDTLNKHYTQDFMTEAQSIQKEIIKKANNNDFNGLLSLMKEKFTISEIKNLAKKLGCSIPDNKLKQKEKNKKKLAHKQKIKNRLK